MSNLVEGILGQLGSGGIAQIAGALGSDNDTTNSAVAAAIPAILAGMAKNSSNEQGAQSLTTALADHDNSVFGQLGDLLGGGGDGAKILSHVLGSKQPQVAQNLAGSSGLNVNSIMKLLPVLAPLVMGFLSKQKQSQGLDANGVGSLLNGDREENEKASPGLGGLAAILDSDGDGSIVDDIIGKFSGN